MCVPVHVCVHTNARTHKHTHTNTHTHTHIPSQEHIHTETPLQIKNIVTSLASISGRHNLATFIECDGVTLCLHSVTKVAWIQVNIHRIHEWGQL